MQRIKNIRKNKRSIYGETHINRSLNNDQIDELKSFYRYYHNKYWIFKKTYLLYKKYNLISNIVASSLVVSSTTAGSITLNPIIGLISGSGILIKFFMEIKDYGKKIETTNFAYKTYEKILIIIRTALRTGVYESIYQMN